jgi:hypothetical protein
MCRRRLLSLSVLAVILSTVGGLQSPFSSDQPLVGLNLTVPNGTSQHGNPRIICAPMTVLGLLPFFAGNFLAHIATVKSSPGETVAVTAFNVLLAFVFPTSGLMRGLNAIARRVLQGKSEIDSACRAGALCVVVRNSSWRPRIGQTLRVKISHMKR